MRSNASAVADPGGPYATNAASTLVVSMESAENAGKRRVGGKAANLARVHAYGAVPPWICVTTAAFEAVMSRVDKTNLDSLQETLTATPSEVAPIAIRLQADIRSTGFTDSEENEILNAFDVHFSRGTRVAVRSSSIAEDSDEHSFAGQFESYLNVQRSSILERILDCFASVFSPHCLLYRGAKSAGLRFGTAVIIQEMVPAASSGVLFTRSPTASRAPQMIVAASYGLGEGVVQDQIDTDSFVLDWVHGDVIEQKVKTKTHQVAAKDISLQGTELRDVPSTLQNVPTLSEKQLRALHAVGRRLEDAMGKPQDVEWAFDKFGTLYLLQARPITTVSSAGTLKLFDCSNISENYHGATTALTFSYVRRYYEEIFSSAARTFGMAPAEQCRNRPVFANLVSYLQGGIYYNLMNWYRMFYAVPGFKHFVASFEHGVGLGGTPPQLEAFKATCAQAGRRNTTLATYVRIAWIYVSLNRMFATHRAMYEQYRKRFEQVRLDELDEDELLALFEEVQQRLGKNWGTPLVNDYYAFNCFMLLERAIKRWCVDPTGEMLGELMRGEVEPVSVAPIRALREVAVLAGKIPALSDALAAGGADVAEVLARPEAAAFNAALASFMLQYGDRRPDELKFEAPTLSERPEILWSLLRNFLRADGDRVDEAAIREKKMGSDSARKRALSALKGQPIRRLLLGFLLSATHKCLVHREYGRFVRSQRCGMERAIIMAIGNKLAQAGAIRNKADIVHLNLEEIEAFVQGTGVTSSIERLIDLRRMEFDANEKFHQPLRVVTNILPQLVTGTEATSNGPAAVSSSALKGTGCSPGRVTGRARVVADPFSTSLDQSDILVARATDPAWAFLMATAAGLIVERGNLLSHAAIIGRELGIPCVIGVVDATQIIRDGQMLSIDGTTGEIAIEAASPGSIATPQHTAGEE